MKGLLRKLSFAICKLLEKWGYYMVPFTSVDVAIKEPLFKAILILTLWKVMNMCWSSVDMPGFFWDFSYSGPLDEPMNNELLVLYSGGFKNRTIAYQKLGSVLERVARCNGDVSLFSMDYMYMDYKGTGINLYLKVRSYVTKPS